MDKKKTMDELARAGREKGGFNGTWLYAENGEIISKGACGFRDAEDKLPMREDSIFEMASVTKMFTATAVMLLVREGKLDLDEEYASCFPEYPYRGVTLRHLLTHTSGMPDDFDTDRWVVPILENEHRIPKNSEMLRFIRESGEAPACAPGEKFRYTDVGYTLLAEAVEKASGVKFEEFLKKNIFEPAGMTDSGIYHTRRDGRPSDRFTRNMVLEDGKYVPSDLSKLDGGYVVGSDGLNGCDYLYTTVFDMLAWDRALREETILTREEQMTMFTPGVLNDGKPAGAGEEDGDDGYGFGWGVNNDPEFGLTVNHSGGMPGLETWFEHFVDRDRVLIVFNCRDCTDAKAYDAFFAGMRAVARDKAPEPVLSVEELAVREPDRSGWERFLGKYDFACWDYRIDEVLMKDGELYVDMAYKGSSSLIKLYPLADGSFAMKPFCSNITFGDGTLSLWDETGKKL
ncbi:MAG: beta-lactamase family protein [Clostridia bacterium]|nr:beta-lactamase family protein [Clostridia bacterium]